MHLQLRHRRGAPLRAILALGKERAHAKVRLLELVALGLPDHEIGNRLFLGPSTVKHQIEDLRAEIGARNRIELAAWAGMHGFYVTDGRARGDA